MSDTDTDTVPSVSQRMSASSPLIRLQSWLNAGVLAPPIIFPTIPRSCLYRTPGATLTPAASMMSASAYRYGAPTLPPFARLAPSSHSGSYSVIRSTPRLTYFSLSVLGAAAPGVRLMAGPSTPNPPNHHRPAAPFRQAPGGRVESWLNADAANRHWRLSGHTGVGYIMSSFRHKHFNACRSALWPFC